MLGDGSCLQLLDVFRSSSCVRAFFSMIAVFRLIDTLIEKSLADG